MLENTILLSYYFLKEELLLRKLNLKYLTWGRFLGIATSITVPIVNILLNKFYNISENLAYILKTEMLPFWVLLIGADVLTTIFLLSPNKIRTLYSDNAVSFELIRITVLLVDFITLSLIISLRHLTL